MALSFAIGSPVVFPYFVTGCQRDVPNEMILNDFESDADLDGIYWECRRLYSLSPEHVTHGHRCLLAILYPDHYPGLALKLPSNDWGRYDSVNLDIFNPQQEKIEITVRIDDQAGYPEYEDRYNSRFGLSPGENRISIPLKTLFTSGTRRLLNLKNITRFMFFLIDTQQIYRLYVDHIRLERHQS